MAFTSFFSSFLLTSRCWFLSSRCCCCFHCGWPGVKKYPPPSGPSRTQIRPPKSRWSATSVPREPTCAHAAQRRRRACARLVRRARSRSCGITSVGVYDAARVAITRRWRPRAPQRVTASVSANRDTTTRATTTCAPATKSVLLVKRCWPKVGSRLRAFARYYVGQVGNKKPRDIARLL